MDEKEAILRRKWEVNLKKPVTGRNAERALRIYAQILAHKLGITIEKENLQDRKKLLRIMEILRSMDNYA